jgi:hypothetical protein
MHHRLAVLLGSLALVTSVDAHAKCLMLPIVADRMTAPNAAVAPGGGVLVGLTYGKQDAPRHDTSAEKKDWRFKQGGKLVEPTIKTLAPGLALYELVGDGGTLVDDKQQPIVTIRRAKTGTTLTTPAVKAVFSDYDGESHTARWEKSYRLMVELTGTPPPGVLGIIVYRNSQPVNWVVVDPKATGANLHAGGHCANTLPGTSVPTSGEVSIAYFDSTGRVSAPSPVITIKKQKRS